MSESGIVPSKSAGDGKRWSDILLKFSVRLENAEWINTTRLNDSETKCVQDGGTREYALQCWVYDIALDEGAGISER